jgi:hypothetical protein
MKASEPRPTDGCSPIRERWIERVGEDHAEGRAGALFRAALRGEPLEAGRLAAIEERLHAKPRRPKPHRAWRLAIAVGLMLSGGAMTATANWYFHRSRPANLARPEKPTPPPGSLKRRARPGFAVAPPPALAVGSDTVSLVDEPTPSRSRTAVTRKEPSRGARPVDPVGSTAPPPSITTEPASALAEESKLLTRALRKLRQDDDAPGALSILDEHDLRFAGAALAPEATLARIEALIKVHRNTDALSRLDGIAPSPIGIGRDLLIARAELRATAGRCAMAALDFDDLLLGTPAFDAITERALWGRASCRARSADPTGARVDLEAYLSRFPSGRFAGDARTALGE